VKSAGEKTDVLPLFHATLTSKKNIAVGISMVAEANYGHPMEQGRPLYFCPVVSSSSSSSFSSPNLSRRRLDVCHTSTHGVALVRI